MVFGIIKERKSPPDRRVVLTPASLTKIKQEFPEIVFKVEASDIRIFKDQDYIDAGFEVTNDVSDCDVLIGVKEVPLEYLISNKKYFFFSHTIKKQPSNRKLLISCLEKNIELYDHETIVDEHNNRLIGFGKYAGIVGTYNAFRAFGLKFELFNLVKADTLNDQSSLIERLKRPVLPPIKIVLTGYGKVGSGAKEMLDAIKIKEVSVEDYLTKNYDHPVYTHLDVDDYNKRIDEKSFEKHDFYEDPTGFTSNFERFTKVSDIYIAGHFYGNGAPVILTQEMLKSAACNIKVVADISCDVAGPIASTIRSSTIADPLYGYYPTENKEVDYMHPAAIVVMAVDNLPCELPKNASEGFAEMFSKHVIPAFYNNDKDSILQRALITKNGKLTERFLYLQDYVDGE